jgi:hypothetical protein
MINILKAVFNFSKVKEENNKIYDTAETVPKSIGKVVERFKDDSRITYVHTHMHCFVQALQ